MIFPTQSISRARIKWETKLDELTPWEHHLGIWFKREDYFCPLGYGGPNGSKLRQLIWYINRYRKGKDHILTGASVQSPQLSMSAIVGAHFGLYSRLVVYSKPSTVTRHDNPRIAQGFGATFEYATGPYNPIIQRHVEQLRTPKSLVVEYGITMPHDRYSREEIRGFHSIGARQTANIPAQVDRLIVPAGSCNTLCSILLGLHTHRTKLRELFTIGIGPDKQEWIRDRLAYMGVNASDFRFHWRHHSLHDTGYSSYSDKFTGEKFHRIEFHPTYEAKVWRWLRQHEPIKPDYRTGFWIIGSAPQYATIKPHFTSTAHANRLPKARAPKGLLRATVPAQP